MEIHKKNHNDLVKTTIKHLTNPKLIQKIIDRVELTDYDYDYNLFSLLNGYVFRGCISFKLYLSQKCVEERQNEYLNKINNLACKYRVKYFLDALGIKYLGDKIPRLKHNLIISNNIVIKPIDFSSAYHCYLVFTPTEIQCLNPKKNFESVTDVIKFMPDKWYVIEPLIKYQDKKVIDIKFYAFYGFIGSIVYITNEPTKTLQYVYITSEKPLNYWIKFFNIDPNLVTEVIRISLEIPTEFVRIDYLLGNDGYYFGELTLKPGSFSKKPAQEDYLMGQYILQAKERLFRDMLNGKSFDSYKKFLAKLNEIPSLDML